MADLRIAMAQLNLLVGDPAANADKIVATIARARDELKAQLVVFPELSLSGYPPEDLLLRPSFHRAVTRALQRVTRAAKGIDVVIGFPRAVGARLYNAAAVLRDGKRIATYHKHLLPNYGVFDEKRYFLPGRRPCVVDIAGVKVGITICEDAWAPPPIAKAVKAGAQLVININASPYDCNKTVARAEVASARARENGVPIVYVNLVGGQDELVFDGDSFVVDALGQVTQRAPTFVEDLSLALVELRDARAQPRAAPVAPSLSLEESVYRALVLGVRDYTDKNGFRGVVLGLSGGIDSALTLAIAVDALGAERVHAVSMPSRYTAQMSIDDARAEAEALGVQFSVLSIEAAFAAFLSTLSAEFAGCAPDVTEENLQARVRGSLLMAISNKSGKIVLTTGNKSEMAVGYATLYGDMAGGFAVIKDVPKTLVYRLARLRNRDGVVIPARVIEREPSAELAPNQRDSDSLPPYPVLDRIIEQYIEHNAAFEQIVAEGIDAQTVRRVIQLIHRAEYKRRQAPPGVRITPRAFGRDWRYPITTGFGKD